MKILIVSDTHRQNGNLCKVISMTGDIDMLIHLGDSEGSEEYFKSLVKCPIEIVRGNNDFFSRLPREKMIDIGKYKVFLTHGHYYNVSFTYDKIIEEARYRGADIVMFGHIHCPVVEHYRDLILVNPGSLSYPRQANRRPSYIIMETDESGEAEFTIKYL